MKPSRLLKLFLAATTISNFFSAPSALAAYFGEAEVDRTKFAVVAAPYRHGYNLLILEQIPGQRPCWNERGANPTIVEPLFLEFDFTNSCIRSSDSNSYSIRFEGQDYGMDYLLNVVKKDDELHLIGTPRDSSKPEINLGKTNGLSSGSLKIELRPEWRLTKRTYNGSVTAHLYLSNTKDNNAQFISQSVYQHQPTAYPVQQNPNPNPVYQQQPAAYPVQQNPSPNPVYQQQPAAYPVQQSPNPNPVYQQ